MKTAKIFFLLVVLALVGCQDDDLGNKYSPAKVGDKIIFGGTSGYADESRTVYGDKTSTGTEIKWYEGDMVRILCDKATGGEDVTGGRYSDYGVVGGASTSTLTSSSETSLQWGTEGEHTFYGVYPAPAQLSGSGDDSESTTASSTLKLENNVVTGYLPTNQAPWSSNENNYVQSDADGNYTIHPAMRYAYMVAKNTAKPEDGRVTLVFRPIVTAVEITLKNVSKNVVDGQAGETFPITGIKAFSVTSDKVICGNFTTTINDVTTDDTNVDPFTVSVTDTEDSYKTVFIPAAIEELGAGKTATFTAFMILNGDESLNNLTINIHTASGVKSGKVQLADGGVIVQAKKKNFLRNLPLNIGVTSTNLNGSNWVGYIENKEATLVSSLSIPGAGGATSAEWSSQETSGSIYSQQQTLYIADMWNQGVRCFEFAVDRPGASVYDNTDLGEEYVVCSGKQTSKKLKQAVDSVKLCLEASPSEFAMVIITYERLGGWDGNSNNIARDPQAFMTALRTFWDNYSDVTDLFDPAKTTVATAQGKLFCIARPTSAGQDDFNMAKSDGFLGTKVDGVSYTESALLVENNDKILVVNGWGSLKDKWSARGYTSCVFHRGNGNTASSAPDYVNNGIGRPFDVSKFTYSEGVWGYGAGWMGNDPVPSDYTSKVDDVMGTTANFYYGTQVGGTTKSNNAWVQEWARVSPDGAVVMTIGEIPASPAKDDIYRRCYWAPTIKEKELRIEQTLDYAIGRSLSNVSLYINSLCGFFIDQSVEVSYYPHSLTDYSGAAEWSGYYLQEFALEHEFAGMEGNIDSYAKFINNYFYNLLIEKKNDGTLNSSSNGMGIVLMDRVSNDPIANPAGYYIPQLIWSNNKFETDPDVEDGTSSGEGNDGADIEITWVE